MIRKLPSVGLDPFRQSRLERNQPRLTCWDLVLKTALANTPGTTVTQSAKAGETQPPNRQTSSPNQQTIEENLYAIHYGRYGKLRQHRSLLRGPWLGCL